MSQHKCELCGTPVKVVGRTTKHYEPIRPVAEGNMIDSYNDNIKGIFENLRLEVLASIDSREQNQIDYLFKNARKDAQKGLV